HDLLGRPPPEHPGGLRHAARDRAGPRAPGGRAPGRDGGLTMHDVTLPANVRLGPNSLITGDYLTRDRAFRLLRSRLDPGLVIGASCTMDGVMFHARPEARVDI